LEATNNHPQGNEFYSLNQISVRWKLWQQRRKQSRKQPQRRPSRRQL